MIQPKLWNTDDSRKNTVKSYTDKLPFVKTVQKLIDNEKKVKK